MKKALLFTLAALCVSAAQAVTVAWTNRHLGNNGWAPSIGTNTAESPFLTVVVSDTVYANPTGTTTSYSSLTSSTITDYKSATISQVILGKGKNNNWMVAGQYLVIEDANGNRAVSNAATLTDSFDFRIYDGDTFKSSAQALAFVFDDSISLAAGTYKLWIASDEEGNTLVTPGTNSEMPTIDKVAAIEIQAAAIVPEPTALALLALGVAGLALKRKVA